MGTSSSKPSTFTKSKRQSNAPKGYYDYDMPMPQGYWPTGANYGYGHAPPGQNYAPVIPPPPISQYPPYYPHHYPQTAPVIPMPQPQPHQHPQPTVPLVKRVPAPRIDQPDTQPITAPPVIPAPPPHRERHTKRKTTSKKMPVTIITFGDLKKRKPPGPEGNSAPVDDSGRLSNVTPSQPGRSSPQPQTHTPLVSSPSRSTHERRASTQSSPHAQQRSKPIASTYTYERPNNPLPKPPINIYKTSPYKHLFKNLELPDIPTLGPGQTLVVQREEEVPQEAKKGLFGLKKKMPSTIRQTNYVYMPHPMSASRSNPPPTSATSSHFPPTSATTSEGSHAGFQQPPSTSAATSEQPTSPRTAQSFMQGNDTQSDHTETTPDVIYFNQDTDFAPLLNHYPYSVSYERVKYPTATHLLEALKFLPENDRNHGIAELIRTCEDTADVYRLSQEHADAQNEVDDDSYMQTMETVMYLKFYQHADLRDIMLGTGQARLIYDDPSDSFWGIGGAAGGEPGENRLGELAERVRARLLQDRIR